MWQFREPVKKEKLSVENSTLGSDPPPPSPTAESVENFQKKKSKKGWKNNAY